MQNTMIKIPKKLETTLQMLQYVYQNVSTLTPEKIYERAEQLGVSKCVAGYLLADDSPLLSHEAVGDVHVFKWLPTEKITKQPMLPNLYMVAALHDKIAHDKQQDAMRREDERQAISQIRHPLYTKKSHFKTEKFVQYIHDNAQDWTRTSLLRPSDVYRELRISDMIFTVMIYTNVVLKRGCRSGSEYKWNPDVAMRPELVMRIIEERENYAADKSSVRPIAGISSVSAVRVDIAPPASPAVEQKEPPRETETPDCDIKVKKGAFRKNFAWTPEEEWAVKQGMSEGLDYRQIAHILNRSEGSVAGKIHWMRGRGELDTASVTCPSGQKATIKKSSVEQAAEFADSTDPAKEIKKHDALPIVDLNGKAAMSEKKKTPGLFKRVWYAIINKEI
jgi:hypothetical protein